MDFIKVRNFLYLKKNAKEYIKVQKRKLQIPLARSSVYRSNDEDREYNSPDTLKSFHKNTVGLEMLYLKNIRNVIIL